MAAMLSISFCHFFYLFNYDIIPAGFLIKSTKKEALSRIIPILFSG